MDKTRTVVVLRKDLLPPSETFVRQQLLNDPNFRSVLVGSFGLTESLDLSCVPHVIAAEALPIGKQVSTRIVRKLGLERWLLRRAIGRLNPLVIHIHFGLDAVALWPVVSRFNMPILVTLHGYDINVYSAWWNKGSGGAENVGYHARLRDIALDRRVTFIAVSKHVLRSALSVGIPEAKVSVCHIGVDVSAFMPNPISFSQRPKNVLFIGRLTEKKGCGVLIRAMAIVRQKHPDAHLRIAGSGDMDSALKALSAELGVNAAFLGLSTPAQVRAELATARIFCLPSITAINGDSEGLPIVLLEAQACGVPVVTSAKGGVEEGMVDGETGRCFREGDVMQLASILEELIGDLGLLEAMGRRGRALVENTMSLQRCNQSLANLYAKQIEHYQRGELAPLIA